MKHQPLTIETLRRHYELRRDEIQARLSEFAAIKASGTDDILLQELVFCIFTANASAKMGYRSIEAVKHLLYEGTNEELAKTLTGIHRFPNARAAYIVTTRDYLRNDCNFQLRDKLENFTDDIERRDWLAQTREIKGLAYKEASHYLRNIGFRGYAILDKHILKGLVEMNIIEEAKPPSTRAKYLIIEDKLRKFADDIEIDFDELDLVLWSIKTGEILK
ncbi:MAG: N-glycosylase/DNA lyase [Pyrinomonadaceae bacterium]|nr:N-glycosylase/DNA lyase [Pyrinomonadaceae bacterium]